MGRPGTRPSSVFGLDPGNPPEPYQRASYRFAALGGTGGSAAKHHGPPYGIMSAAGRIGPPIRSRELTSAAFPRCLHNLATRPARGTVSMLVITGGLVHSVSAARGEQRDIVIEGDTSSTLSRRAR